MRLTVAAGAVCSIRRIEFAIDGDALRITDESHGGHGAALLAEPAATLHAQAFEASSMRAAMRFAKHARGIDFRFAFSKRASASSAFALSSSITFQLASVRRRCASLSRRAVEEAAILAQRAAAGS
ncbi:MAG: hypothetical protein IPK32_26215 [Verrucomicrobiaceae bacterium]|nr:hypothetical protein [Verrucomicrobiaceae bacterium]